MIETIRKKIQLYQPQIILKKIDEAAIFLLVSQETSPQIYFIKRSKNLKQHSGEVAFPGGKKDINDENLLQTAYRETEEEIGINKKQIQLIGSLDQQVSLHHLKITPFVGLISPDSQFQRNQAEVDKIFTVNIDFFLTKTNYSTSYRSLNQRQLKVHQFLYQDERIWGLTAHILVHFLIVVFNIDFEFFPRKQ